MAIKNYTTKIDSLTSIGEIQSSLAKHGATKVMIDYENGEPIAVSFALNGVNGKSGFYLPAPVEGTIRIFKKQKVKVDENQAKRTAWRNVRDWVLSQMALVESCDVAVEEVFFPYLANKSGNTIYQLYSNGQLLLGEGDAK